MPFFASFFRLVKCFFLRLIKIIITGLGRGEEEGRKVVGVGRGCLSPTFLGFALQQQQQQVASTMNEEGRKCLIKEASSEFVEVSGTKTKGRKKQMCSSCCA
jgi:hypothetical protein